MFAKSRTLSFNGAFCSSVCRPCGQRSSVLTPCFSHNSILKLSNTRILPPYLRGCDVYKSQFISSIKQTYSKEPTPSLGCDLDWEVLHFFPKSERAVKWGKGSKQGECNELNLVSYRNPVTNGNTRQIR